MTSAEEDKQKILKELHSHLACLASLKYQFRVWIEGRGPERDDYDETYMLFSNFCNFLKSKYQNCGITEEQYQKVIALRDQFEKFNDHDLYEFVYPWDVILSAEWSVVIKAAEEALHAFGWENNRE